MARRIKGAPETKVSAPAPLLHQIVKEVVCDIIKGRFPPRMR
jgi:hypothetical protein